MKTTEIMNCHEYDCLAGTIKAIPVSDVLQFLTRMEDRLSDIQDGMPIKKVEDELAQLKKGLYDG